MEENVRGVFLNTV